MRRFFAQTWHEMHLEVLEKRKKERAEKDASQRVPKHHEALAKQQLKVHGRKK